MPAGMPPVQCNLIVMPCWYFCTGNRPDRSEDREHDTRDHWNTGTRGYRSAGAPGTRGNMARHGHGEHYTGDFGEKRPIGGGMNKTKRPPISREPPRGELSFLARRRSL